MESNTIYVDYVDGNDDNHGTDPIFDAVRTLDRAIILMKDPEKMTITIIED